MGFSPDEWGLFYGISLVVGFIWLAAQTTDYKRFRDITKNKGTYGGNMQLLFGIIWAILIALVIFALFYWLRSENGREHYTTATWIATINVVLAILASPVHFGTYHHTRLYDGMWQVVGWFILLAAAGTAVTVTILQGIAYGKSESPADVTRAFWLYLPYTLWLVIATVWSGIHTWGGAKSNLREQSNLQKNPPASR